MAWQHQAQPKQDTTQQNVLHHARDSNPCETHHKAPWLMVSIFHTDMLALSKIDIKNTGHLKPVGSWDRRDFAGFEITFDEILKLKQQRSAEVQVSTRAN